MNKTEERYALSVLEPALLAGEILWYAFEPWKLRLGPSNFYTPDFGVVTAERVIENHEVKAVWVGKGDKPDRVGFKEDARQKVRDCAQLYPFYRFIVAAHLSARAMRSAMTNQEWIYETIKSHTIRPPPT